MNPRGANRNIAEESPGAGGALNAPWRPAGLVYLTAMLIGLAVGLWPGSIRVSVDPYSPSLTPAVQTLVIAQVVFYLVVYPVIVVFRASFERGERWWPDTVIETLFWTLSGAAFFVPAVWLSGSVPSDAIRGMGYVCALWPMAWVCGVWLASHKAGNSAIMFISVFIATGLPWLWYVAREFFPAAGWHETLWKLCPVMQAWDVAAPRGAGGGLSPSPVWAIVVWPVVAAVMFALWVTVPARDKAGQGVS
ncbi:MAG: hypothetical protein ISS69_11890 [Phycisphaerae bacterium]|nr:hypothetical protein [Planctomycetota bacterium]MBL7220808.1 hypothetical protein [Phycisphaerae bacterium]